MTVCKAAQANSLQFHSHSLCNREILSIPVAVYLQTLKLKMIPYWDWFVQKQIWLATLQLKYHTILLEMTLFVTTVELKTCWEMMAPTTQCVILVWVKRSSCAEKIKLFLTSDTVLCVNIQWTYFLYTIIMRKLTPNIIKKNKIPLPSPIFHMEVDDKQVI